MYSKKRQTTRTKQHPSSN